MRVAIAGAGAVGRSIARELIGNGHDVLLIDKEPSSIKPDRVPDADWLLADACELASLNAARLDDCDVVIATTGDDKANLVTAMLGKTELGVPRVVGRINHPTNEWLFTEAWGVDVNVSTPRQDLEPALQLEGSLKALNRRARRGWMTRTQRWCWRARPERGAASAGAGTAPPRARSRPVPATPQPVTGGHPLPIRFTRPSCVSHEYEEGA